MQVVALGNTFYPSNSITTPFRGLPQLCLLSFAVVETHLISQPNNHIVTTIKKHTQSGSEKIPTRFSIH
ncbi:hypothetical protein FAM21834_00438 [Lentilactobacillus parabuchneri]|jgi:hypothetical protein|nr:hypothetical protein FAM21731_00494 [Lentilactobacillus parabuchneri]ORN03196.1 hypothetical protein FAM21823_00545 [Lentilactobacillus parabuchneri]ORN05439.1 hypothetical protein FAM21829_00349 [Lentilactobacillus parabuchneri]ORN10194.1 hypothetical protein FAM23163_00351 [Lentilactobacillus parabuchneri]ORN11811.1 hypothetical protein FAM21834_00438 [Lentilactobacillus parabuchneri]